MNQYWYFIIEVSTSLRFPQFFPNVSFLFHSIPFRIPHYIQMPHLFRLFWVVIVFQTSLDSFKDYWSEIWYNGFQLFSDFFLIIRLEYYVLERNTSEVKCYSHHNISKVYYQYMLTLITRLEVMFVRFSTIKSLFFSFHTALFGRKSLCEAHTYGGGSHAFPP